MNKYQKVSRIFKISLLAMIIVLGAAIVVYFVLRHINTPNQIFFEEKYVAHAQYVNDSCAPNSMDLFRMLVEEKEYKILEVDVMFTVDGVPVLCHDWNISNIAVDSLNNPADVVVEQLTYSQLCKYNFAKHPETDEWRQIDRFEDIVNYAKQKNICLQVDIQKWFFPRSWCRKLYRIAADADMTNSILWEVSDGNLRFFAECSPFLIYQLDGKWTHEELDKYRWLNYWSSLLVFTKQFHKESELRDLNFRELIEHGHRNGYLMKNSVINNQVLADSLFSMGTDLITTGTLK